MPIVFERPTGPHCDIKELEYVSALLQTGPTVRRDGTVTSEDVVTYLKSRHGIEADVDYIRTVFMPGLAGALGENTDPIFDIVELTCILLIPHFVRERRDATPNDTEGFFSKVLDMVLRDLTGSAQGGERPKLTREFVTALLACYGEEDNAAPADIDAMLRAAGAMEDDAELTPDSLARACTSDLKHYRLEWEESDTTHFDDCFHGTYLDAKASDTGKGIILGNLPKKKDATQNSSDEAGLVAESSHLEMVREVHRVFTFPSIDFVAENYRSGTFSVILWITLVILYASYVSDAVRFCTR